MRSSSTPFLGFLLAASACVSTLVLSGCGTNSRAYTPASSASARDALDAALAGWKAGAKPEGLKAGETAVNAVDFQWRDGRALESYEITDELPGQGDHDKRFKVRLKLKKARADEQAEYVLIGRDPVWAYRAEDYARLLNMDNNPRPTGKAGAARR